jgi:hypothetical protein
VLSEECASEDVSTHLPAADSSRIWRLETHVNNYSSDNRPLRKIIYNSGLGYI